MLSLAEKINFHLIWNGSVTHTHGLGFYVNEKILHLNKAKLIPKNFETLLLIIFQWGFWKNVSLNLADTSWTNQYMSKRILFSRLLEASSVFPVFKNVRERSMTKNYRPVSLLSAVRKVFKILVDKAGLKKLFVCCHPADQTPEVPTQNILLGL